MDSERSSSGSRDATARVPGSSPITSHRQSFSQDLRGPPPSPRSHRHSSIGNTGIFNLYNNPPQAHESSSAFAGRDWKTVTVLEVVDPAQLHWAETSTSVEDATKLLVESGSPNVVLVRENDKSKVAVTTFDYSDLNAYLLLLVGINEPEGTQAERLQEVARKGREGDAGLIPLRDLQQIGWKEPLITLPHTATLEQAVKFFGGGIHRIVILKDGTRDAIAVLTQLRLMNFFWENGKIFPAVEQLLPATLSDLKVGARPVVSINGDRPLNEALELMYRQSVTSLPVLDNHMNVVGNISHVDTRLLTTSASLPLLRQSCIHFISVILSERGMNDGKDSFPVFYIHPFASLAHTIAKLVATRSHRMWVVDAPSPIPPGPASPANVVVPNTDKSAGSATLGQNVSVGNMPGSKISGRLTGVISLTDVLNLIAKASGLSPQDPNEARRRRRDSSSSSVRASIDSARSSSVDLTRSGSKTSLAGTRR